MKYKNNKMTSFYLNFSSALCILPKIQAKTIKYRGEDRFGKLKMTSIWQMSYCMFSVC